MGAAVLLVLALGAQDPVQVGARLNDAEIHAGETTILRVDVETEGERARIDRFRTLPPGIEVVGTRDYDQRQFSLPGGTRRFITREFVLQARAPGRYRIPSVTVEVGGEVYTTRSLLLTVTSAPARERGEVSGGEDGVVLRAWLDADTVYVGEQVTLEVDAMFSQTARMRLRRAPEYEAPSPSGFWVHELPDPSRPVSRSIGNEIYEVQRFRRAFFPLSAGRYTIPPARLEYEVRRGLLYAPETRELTSDPLVLTVLPVPADPPPAFRGAVGDYTMRARVEPATVPAGEAAVVTVTVEGVGNVKALPAPILPDVAGMDAFPPSEEAESRAEGTTIRGTKTFSWVLIPRQAGEVEIPSIRYAYFDPERGQFETLAVGPLPLTVTPAATPTDAGAPAPATIRFVKTSPEGDPLGWVRSRGFAAAMTLPLLLLALALAWRRREGRKGRVSPGRLRRERKQTVRELAERADDPTDRGLFADAESFARDWLARRLGVPRPRATDPDTLAAAGIPEALAEGVRRVLDRLSAGRYAPAPPAPADRRAVIGELGKVLEAVDRAAPPPGPGSARRSASAGATYGAMVLLGIAGGLAIGAGPAAAGGPVSAAPAVPAVQNIAPAGADGSVQDTVPATTRAAAREAGEATDPTALFARGLAAFERGDYTGAGTAFGEYTRRVPRDPAGWYNLGTAQYRAGQMGWSTWAWLRALRLDPRDGDARHNLRVAGVPPELVQRATPTVPLAPAELLLLAALAWLLAGGAGTVWIVQRRRSAAVAAAVGLAVALLLAGVWWGSTRGAETLIVLDGATLRAGPALRSEPVTALTPGAGLEPVDRYGDWVRVRTLRGEEGWIERNRTGSL